MKISFVMCLATLAVASLAALAAPQDVAIRVDAARPGHAVSRYLTGACIEDVNHEIYGGIYSQMIFGESFQEPPTTCAVKGFTSPDGEWSVEGGVVSGGAGPGPKLIAAGPATGASSEVGVDVYLPGAGGGNAGLILNVNKAGAGADNFDGYEISIDAQRKRVIVGRHQHNFRLLKEAPRDVSADRWIKLEVKVIQKTIEASIDGKLVIAVDDPQPLPPGVLGLRQWQRPARYRNFWTGADSRRTDIPFEPSPSAQVSVSGMWGPIASGSAQLAAALDQDEPFAGRQSQRITFSGGDGEVGIENRGLNRQGMNFAKGQPYDGYVWLRAQQPTEVFACLESRDGERALAQVRIAAAAGEWRRYDFSLTPAHRETSGRFALRLKSPGAVHVGYAFLQPGEWGRYKSLPVRKDVVQGLIDQGITALRYGGSMVNAPEYRWKKMLGPRDRRPPYRGHWYPYSSNGWGIIDFLDLCEAAGFLAIPDFNIDESPQDMADFVEYVNGPIQSEWGKRRAADGHPAPYNLRHLELGNEEKVDDAYYAKFERLAKAIWAVDPQMVLVVGDFQYEQPINDPMHVRGAASGITSLAAHQKILALAKQADREVWFDVHVWTQGPASASAQALSSYVDAIERLAQGAKHRVVVFEFNANTHDQLRAVANAGAIARLINDGRTPVALSANGLQPDGQNDNGWDQGLLFLNPAGVWLQPPGYVTQMFARNHQPRAVAVETTGGDGALTAAATRSDDGKTLVVFVVNDGAATLSGPITLDGYIPSKPLAKVEALAAAPGAVNTADAPQRIKPTTSEWRHEANGNAAVREFPPHSFTVIRFE